MGIRYYLTNSLKYALINTMSNTMEIEDDDKQNSWDLVVSARVQRFLASIGYQGDISKIILTPTVLVPNPYMATLFEYCCIDPTADLSIEEREEGLIKLYSYNSHFSFVLDELDQYVIQDTYTGSQYD